MPNRVRNPWHKRFANAGHTWLQDILHGYCINERLNITTDTFWALRFVRNENLTVHSLESIVWPTSFILDLMSIPLVIWDFQPLRCYESWDWPANKENKENKDCTRMETHVN